MTERARCESFVDQLILNPVQREAVLYDDGPQLVFAGAGTGKTRVLTAKIAFLIQQKGVPPAHIFAATFTNKAAREMKSRVESLTGLSCAGLWIGTFHSLCARILRREAHHLGYTSSFTIYDEDDRASLVRKVLKKLGIEERAMAATAARKAISHWKNRCVAPDDAGGETDGYQQQQLVRVYRDYQKALVECNAMDFDDLLQNTVRLWRTRGEVLRRYREMFAYVLVDEYQDTNQAQFDLVHLLAAKHKRVFVVGDDDQSIYGWRGAQIRNILAFEKQFDGTRTFRLEQNYRSTRAILEFANAVIAANATRAGKCLWTQREGAAEVAVTKYADDRREAEGVVREISRLLGRGVKPRDILVLFRTNAQSRPFEDALRKNRIAYALVGGISFYQRKEIKDCLAYLRLLVNPRDDVSFERIVNVPTRGIGPKARAELVQAAAPAILESILGHSTPQGRDIYAHKGVAALRELFAELRDLMSVGATPQELLREILTQTGYVTMLEADGGEEGEARIENINELLNALAVWSQENEQGTLGQFLEEVSLIADLDSLDEETERVCLMTLHSAKGLEAPHVFVTGLEDGLLPARQNLDDPARLEEERRLFYVGITRAKDALRCSFTERRWRFGSIVPMQRSHFLDGIASELYHFADQSAFVMAETAAAAPRARRSAHTPIGGGRRKQAQPQRETAFEDYSQEEVHIRMGQHVRHKKYGTGRVLNVSGFSDDMRVTVLFQDGERRRMLAKFAGLEVL